MGTQPTRGSRLLRYLDAYLGRFLIFLLRPFKKQERFPQKITSIALLKLIGIGDLILLTGIIHDLRNQYPHATITLFCGYDNSAQSLLVSLDSVILLPIKNPLKAIREVRKKAFDLCIDCGQWSRLDALLTFFAKARYTIGFRTAQQQRHYLYDLSVEHRNAVHELENFQALISSFVQGPYSLPEISCNKESRAIAGTYIVFHPWPSGIQNHLKRWPTHYWVELAQKIAQTEKSATIVITGGKEDKQDATLLCQAIQSAVQEEIRLHNLAGLITLSETASILHHAHCVVSVNTGIMHLAAATAVPLVALHGPTSVKRWGPISSTAISLVPKGVAHGYLHLGFEYPRQTGYCMDKIFPEDVLSAIHKICGKNN